MERIYKARVEAAAKDMEESYQDIEAALTEMESCMKLLFPEFGLIDLHTGNSCPSDSQPDKSCRSDDEEPCCSRNLMENKSRGEDWSSKVEKVGCRDDKNNPGKESTADRGMMEKKGSDTEEENGERRWEDERKEDQEEEEGLMEEEREGAEESSEEEEDEGLTDEDSFIRSSGLISHTYSLDVNLSPVLHVKETEDNEPVVSTMMELHRLISTKHLPAVQGWVQVFTKSHAEPQLLRRALSLKKSLEAALHKHEELHIDCKTRVRKVLKREQQSDSDRAAGVWRCLVITVRDQSAAPAGPALR
ncbi:hypothetical protein CHARACLAT_029526 [Characodon lateralis]|uniref:UV-stimulated scaffold protein A n=1 Tax=Characodon lateralis TaxID=208331 RepID=A0ABU7EDV9_9TELE|nr:hypothetical protein [Characodon lateralis]